MKWWILAIHYIVTAIVFAKHEVYSETLNLASSNWINVVSFNINRRDNCPQPWKKITVSNNMNVCGAPNGDAGCTTAIFNMNGTKYIKLTGVVRGYQKGTTDGFRASRDDGFGINEAYVDGVSITISNPRRHVWTYAAGLTSNGNYRKSNCPCSVTPGPDPPSFVGEDYYCQSGSEGFPDHSTYYRLPLWTGDGCTDNCCANIGAPRFFREFPAPQHGDIEVRICRNQPLSDEGVFIDKLIINAYIVPE